jgi:SAM-dependent methyltransferase
MTVTYADKNSEYFTHARTEIEPLLPARLGRVLEVGCGAGATLAWLRHSHRCDYVAAMELSERSAEQARRHADLVVTGNAETLLESAFHGQTFDLVLCLDVLEHMVDPWRFVQSLAQVMSNDATAIFSIPNVRHLSVLLPLVVGGQWRYEAEGILDRTHLRFFTRISALQLVSTPPLQATRWLHNIPRSPSRLGLLNRVTFGVFADFLAFQYLISVRKLGPELPPPGK